ncbi:MAG: GAF domain-containing protein [Piscinibacter sp.]|uniref:GAF domain-containing protein n=1 Tax=Piscinibacter sp. TaxID=1903157 RepID=UPI003D0C1FFB
MKNHPAFGEADLTNCERELIHLAGSVQPHGVLLTVREPGLVVMQASANAAGLLGMKPDALLGRPLAALGGDLAERVAEIALAPDLDEPVPLRCRVAMNGAEAAYEGVVHRVPGQALVVEIEPLDTPAGGVPVVDIDGESLQRQLNLAVQRFGAASTLGTLADAVVRCVRDMTGYDRVMVYKFDPEGHGRVIAEARDPRLESLLGHHYPSTDIPQRARELYLRNRVRLLVDVDYRAAELVPRLVPGLGTELDMSMCSLRSMSPLHLQYLRNMGVTATLVVSLVREGQLWGLVACHHYRPFNLRYAVRAACDLLAEVVSTRIAAIENYAYAQVAIQVRRLEQRLIEATSTEGDWRLALLRNPRTLLQPLDATGAALFTDDEILTTGEVPSTPQLRALQQWVQSQPPSGDRLFHCSSVERANPALASLTPTASGVIAARLASDRPDYLMWFRKEQLLTVTWAGNPAKAVVATNPLELSPRSSFAAWSELVRGTALPWSGSELALARAIGASLVDIIVQVNAVRLLIAEHQLAQVRDKVVSSDEAVIVCDGRQRTLFVNDAFLRLAGCTRAQLDDLAAVAAVFVERDAARRAFAAMAGEGHAWRGELTLAGERATPVSVRAEVVPSRDGTTLGFILIFDDLTEARRAMRAREHLEASLAQAAPSLSAFGNGKREPDELMSAILASASLAAMDIADGNLAPSVTPMLEDLEAATRRATALYARIRSFKG